MGAFVPVGQREDRRDADDAETSAKGGHERAALLIIRLLADRTGRSQPMDVRRAGLRGLLVLSGGHEGSESAIAVGQLDDAGGVIGGASQGCA